MTFITRSVRSFSTVSNKLLDEWFAAEYVKGRHAAGKIASANHWIQSGKSFPYRGDMNDEWNRRLNVAKLVRDNKKPEYCVPSDILEMSRIALDLLEKVGSSHPVVEVGGGNSSIVIELLKKNRKVTLVEPGARNVFLLADRIHELGLDRVAINLMNPVNKEMEDYPFSEKCTLIIAQNSLPYCNPSRFLAVWQRMCDSLEKGGMIAGNFFCHPKEPPDVEDLMVELYYRLSLGTWSINDRVAKALFESTGLSPIHYRTTGEIAPSLEFVARKL